MTLSISKSSGEWVNQLQKKILYTLFFLAIYRLGVHIPVPGVDTFVIGEFFRTQGSNFLGMFNVFSGGAISSCSIFALGVSPYITSSIAMQILTMAVSELDRLSKEGESGRRKISQWTRYLTIVMSLVQGFMIASTLERSQFDGASLVLTGGWLWKFITVISLTAGTAFVMWLGEQITDRGLGNGMSLIIFAGIVSGVPSVVANTYTMYTSQSMELFKIFLMLLLCFLIVAMVVFVEQGVRQIPVEYAKKQVGMKVYGGYSSHLPLRLNLAGVMPPIFATSALQIPMTVASFWSNTRWGQAILGVIGAGDWLYNLIYVALIMFFSYAYTAMVFRVDDVAENLKKHGGYIPGVRPGPRTSEYLQEIVDRLILVGGLYLSVICILPSLLASRFGIQFSFGGTSLLIVVGVALETFRQIETHRQSLRYENFLKKGSNVHNLRPRGPL